jgi:outer membrane protein OmpA-like peptidoglycan-associated protein
MGLSVLVPDVVIAETDEIPEESEVRPPPIPETEIDVGDAYEISFAFDSDRITEESHPVIDMLVKFMEGNEDIEIELAGFTDHIGNERYNYELALRRARAVKRYMVEQGINSGRIKIFGFGEKMPVIYSDSEDEKDLQMNRRVEYNFTR